MKPSDRQKMCPNCDGRVAYDANLCPYCGTEQAPQEPDSQMPLFRNQTLQDSLTTLYTPPYAQKAQAAYQQEEAPAKKKSELFREVKAPSTMHVQAQNETAEQESTNPLFPILLLSLGSNFFLLGLIQFFFSKGGFLRLEWDASYWFIYALISLPLLFLGFKKSKNFSEGGS